MSLKQHRAAARHRHNALLWIVGSFLLALMLYDGVAVSHARAQEAQAQQQDDEQGTLPPTLPGVLPEGSSTESQAGPFNDATRTLSRSEAEEAARIDDQFARWEQTANAAASWLANPEADRAALEALRETMERQRLDARALLERLRAAVQPIEDEMAALGPAPAEGETETESLADQRAAVDRRLGEARAQAAKAELAFTRASNLSEQLASRQRAAFTQQLLTSGPTALSPKTWQNALAALPGALSRFGLGVWDTISRLSPAALLAGSAALLLILLYGWRMRVGPVAHAIRRILERVDAAPTRLQAIGWGTLLFVVRAAPATLGAIILAQVTVRMTSVGLPAQTFVLRASEGIVIFAVAMALARILFAPALAKHRVIDVGDKGAIRACGLVAGLVGLLVIRRTVLETAEADGTPFELLTILNTVAMVLAAPMIWHLAQLRPDDGDEASTPTDLHHISDGEDGEDDADASTGLLSVLRLIGVALAVFLPVAAIFGYYALSGFVFERCAATAAVLVGLSLIFVIVRRLLDPVQPGEAAAESASKGMSSQRALAAVMAGLILSLLAVPILAYVWGASITDLLVAAQRLSEGFSVGETRFSPTDLLIVVAVLVTGLWLTRFLQRLLRSSVLPNMGIDRGAQTSLSAGFGYLGFFVTALLAISAAGLDLSNLAIVAGALSVGIGFGLQNIVNNFVSGIILLAERPIKVGDWIEVGGAGGYVRRVNVRSTEIETFDRASVIVPNSDLISNQVTNWTHKTMSGRVIAKVGVSYDCDPEQVRAILQEVGASHPMVLRFPKPVVLFRGFGDSALDFELRVIIRDVNWMLSVQSDLNLAIYKRFKEEGIEIPFPQRVLHVTGGAVADDGATAGNGHAAEVPPLTAVPPKA